jgi:hypothetical protein
MVRLGLGLLLAGALSCGSSSAVGDSGSSTPDSGTDGGSADSGAPDSGTTADAGRDGGALDAGTTPDGGDGGGTFASDCPGSFILCEDFENGIDAGTWKAQGAPTLDTTHAHSGTHSILFSADNTQLRTSNPFPTLSENLWGRVFIYMDQLPPGSTTTQLGPNASFSWSAGNSGDTRVGFRHTRYSGGYNYPGYDFTNTDSQVWPQSQWVCVEWHYASDGGMGTQDYWMNGVALTDMHFDAHPMPAFTYFWIGQYLFGLADGGVPYQMWMDDLALDTQQVGCAR